MCESKLEMFLEELLKLEFISNTNMEQKREEERIRLVKGMMLLDNSDDIIQNYCSWAECHDCNMQKNTLRSAIEYLENAFPEGRESIRLEDIPILIYLADAAEYKEIEPERFREWWFSFWEEKR